MNIFQFISNVLWDTISDTTHTNTHTSRNSRERMHWKHGEGKRQGTTQGLTRTMTISNADCMVCGSDQICMWLIFSHTFKKSSVCCWHMIAHTMNDSCYVNTFWIECAFRARQEVHPTYPPNHLPPPIQPTTPAHLTQNPPSDRPTHVLYFTCRFIKSNNVKWLGNVLDGSLSPWPAEGAWGCVVEVALDKGC